MMGPDPPDEEPPRWFSMSTMWSMLVEAREAWLQAPRGYAHFTIYQIQEKSFSKESEFVHRSPLTNSHLEVFDPQVSKRCVEACKVALKAL